MDILWTGLLRWQPNIAVWFWRTQGHVSKLRPALRCSQFTCKIKYENNNYKMKYCRVLNMNMCRLKLLKMKISECNISEYMGNMCGKMKNEWDTLLLGGVSKETKLSPLRGRPVDSVNCKPVTDLWLLIEVPRWLSMTLGYKWRHDSLKMCSTRTWLLRNVTGI